MDTLAIPNYARVKREVKRIHDEFGIVAPPINPVEIARHLGVEIQFANFGGKFFDISGFYDCETRTIIVNGEEYPLRQTFTIAHELGHHILHAEWARSSEYSVLMRDADYSGQEAHEKEANAFAGHLLVPRFLLDQYWRTTNVEGLSKLFAVSVPVIKNRLAFEYGV
ncbi:ImmA/IrrE family metallo-endopeptidase [Agrobacterium cavarae]|mgnify:CR=1 FL=1|uniref:ImmA/IrrE family metallo-endopeptidase n=1 Tax=Agrobacterium cavarae TaxID=2528239 RepID=UPI0028A71287|nr:ImmA/IrrE family metallo-endopeptidase [Agrobacterium cavarae]